MPVFTCSCGVEFTAAKSNAKYCSDKCRKRTKRSGAEVVQLPDAPEAGGGAAGDMEAVTMSALVEAGRVDTWLGQTALAQARKLDRAWTETASAYASLTREYRATMAEALRGSAAAAGPQLLRDELAARRARHGA